MPAAGALAALVLGVPLLSIAQDVSGEASSLPPLPPLLNGTWDITPQGSVLAFAATDGSLVFVDLGARAVARDLQPNAVGIEYIRWNSRGSQAAVLRKDGRVQFLDAAGAQARESLDCGADRIGIPWRRRSVSFTASDSILVVACGGSTSSLWSLESGTRIGTLVPHSEQKVATAVALSADGESVAVGDEEGSVAIWRTRTGERSHGPLQVKGQVRGLDFDPRAERLAIGGGDCIVRVWDLKSKHDVRTLSHADEDMFGSLKIHDVRFSPDGRRLVSTSSSFFEARVWDLESARRLWSHDYGGGNPGGIQATYTPDGESLLLSLNGLVFCADDGRLQRTLAPPVASFHAPYVSSDGRRAWMLHAGQLRVFDLQQDEPIFVHALSDAQAY